MARRNSEKLQRSVGEEIITGLKNALRYSQGDERNVEVHSVDVPDRILPRRLRDIQSNQRQEECHSENTGH